MLLLLMKMVSSLDSPPSKLPPRAFLLPLPPPLLPPWVRVD
uniref:Uncharacterized protein LOC8260728 n=1 Tax=Rhizophora mucronata TaxID=61149 RepID=A0A2P2JVX2_RHIMU